MLCFNKRTEYLKGKYKRIELRSEKDFDIAEDLKENGWKIISVGFDSIMLEKRV